MERYRLSREDFLTLYPYCLASITEHNGEMDNDHYNRSFGLITFDIGLPQINAADVTDIFLRRASTSPPNIHTLESLAAARDLSIQVFNPGVIKHGSSSEEELSRNILNKHGIPQKFHNGMMRIG